MWRSALLLRLDRKTDLLFFADHRDYSRLQKVGCTLHCRPSHGYWAQGRYRDVARNQGVRRVFLSLNSQKLTNLLSSLLSTQLVLSTAHPAKFAAAVEKALEADANFNFERDVLPAEFHGLLDKERKVIEVPGQGMDELLAGTKEVIQHQLQELFGL